MSIVYLVNSFPEATESYVWEEINELRRRGTRVWPCSVRRTNVKPASCSLPNNDVEFAFPLRALDAARASFLVIMNLWAIRDLLWRVLCGHETISRKIRALAHTWLGAYFAALLAKKIVSHIHVHHGYFSAWVGMVAARILDAGFSMTLHGSDLLVHADYLDTKLADCRFCFTISDFNRHYILDHYPAVNAKNVLVRRLGVDTNYWTMTEKARASENFEILSVGRLHPVKNHAFLLLACRALKTSGVKFRCVIAGDGQERQGLKRLIEGLGLGGDVELPGHIAREQLPALYAAADVVVLTSHSEGIPVTLMEAMAMGRIVIAPNMTGIPELINDKKNGFLYQPNSMDDFLSKLRLAHERRRQMFGIKQQARRQIEAKFDGAAHLATFASEFLVRLGYCPTDKHKHVGEAVNENPVLQQI